MPRRSTASTAPPRRPGSRKKTLLLDQGLLDRARQALGARTAGTVARLGADQVTKSSFLNDALLAAQCARLGATLLTHNVSDFRRLGRHLSLRATAPLPR